MGHRHECKDILHLMTILDFECVNAVDLTGNGNVTSEAVDEPGHHADVVLMKASARC